MEKSHKPAGLKTATILFDNGEKVVFEPQHIVAIDIYGVLENYTIIKGALFPYWYCESFEIALYADLFLPFENEQNKEVATLSVTNRLKIGDAVRLILETNSGSIVEIFLPSHPPANLQSVTVNTDTKTLMFKGHLPQNKDVPLL